MVRLNNWLRVLAVAIGVAYVAFGPVYWFTGVGGWLGSDRGLIGFASLLGGATMVVLGLIATPLRSPRLPTLVGGIALWLTLGVLAGGNEYRNWGMGDGGLRFTVQHGFAIVIVVAVAALITTTTTVVIRRGQQAAPREGTSRFAATIRSLPLTGDNRT